MLKTLWDEDCFTKLQAIVVCAASRVNQPKRLWRKGFARNQKATAFQYLKGIQVQCSAELRPFFHTYILQVGFSRCNLQGYRK